MKRLLIQDTGVLEVFYRGYKIRSAGDFRVEIFGPHPVIGKAESVGDAKKLIDQEEERQ